MGRERKNAWDDFARTLYEVVPLDAGGFCVKVSIPDAKPTTDSSFDIGAAAEVWIASLKTRTQGGPDAEDFSEIQARGPRERRC